MASTLEVHATLALDADILTIIVENAKVAAKKFGKRPDPAEAMNELITRFLVEKDFRAYAENPENYGLF